MMPGAWALDTEEIDAAISALRPEYVARTLVDPTTEDSWIRRFEASFATAAQCRFAVATSSGTTALLASLAALGVGSGDEVVIPANGYVACFAAVRALGAVPVIVDVDETLTIDPAAVVRGLSHRTRAVIVVHMRGMPADMKRIRAITDAHGCAVIEDAAQACGARFEGVPVGGLGTAGCFSLHPTKTISAGEGGVVVSDDHAFIMELRSIVDPEARDPCAGPAAIVRGLNFKLGHVAAAVGTIQLRRVDGLVAEMVARHAVLAEAVDATGLCIRRRVPAGAAPIDNCLVFFVDTPLRAQAVHRELRAVGVAMHRLHDASQVNLRVAEGWPGVHDPCPASMALLERALHLDVNPHVGLPEVERTAARVAAALAAAHR